MTVESDVIEAGTSSDPALNSKEVKKYKKISNIYDAFNERAKGLIIGAALYGMVRTFTRMDFEGWLADLFSFIPAEELIFPAIVFGVAIGKHRVSKFIHKKAKDPHKENDLMNRWIAGGYALALGIMAMIDTPEVAALAPTCG